MACRLTGVSHVVGSIALALPTGIKGRKVPGQPVQRLREQVRIESPHLEDRWG